MWKRIIVSFRILVWSRLWFRIHKLGVLFTEGGLKVSAVMAGGKDTVQVFVYFSGM